ncbi:threonine synthase [bacterium]|nr:threonine synthase [bacterium]
MGYSAWFQSIDASNAERYPLDEIIYRCPRTGSLLEVRHDINALKEKSGNEWKQLFDSRLRSVEFPYCSGVWNKKEWVLPGIADENIVSLFEGGTPLVHAQRYGEKIGADNVYIKMCGTSHTGSFKDLGMTVLVSQVKQMIANGKPIRAVACASTGDTSAALSAYCAAAGIPSIVLLPKNKISTAQLVQPIANGAKVLSLETDFDGCMALVQELCKTESIYLANSMNSLRIEGQKSISIEICQQMGWDVPDFIIIPGGNLGNVSALGKGFTMMRELGLISRMPRIVLAQAERANPLYESYKKNFASFEPKKAQPTLASAIQIGNPVSVEKAVSTLKQFEGIVEQATEEELANASALADITGMFTCPHTGVALAVLQKLVSRKIISRSHRAVVISTAHGLKFSQFKVDYHQQTLTGIDCRYANVPIEIAPSIDNVMRSLDSISQ